VTEGRVRDMGVRRADRWPKPESAREPPRAQSKRDTKTTPLEQLPHLAFLGGPQLDVPDGALARVARQLTVGHHRALGEGILGERTPEPRERFARRTTGRAARRGRREARLEALLRRFERDVVDASAERL